MLALLLLLCSIVRPPGWLWQWLAEVAISHPLDSFFQHGHAVLQLVYGAPLVNGAVPQASVRVVLYPLLYIMGEGGLR